VKFLAAKPMSNASIHGDAEKYKAELELEFGNEESQDGLNNDRPDELDAGSEDDEPIMDGSPCSVAHTKEARMEFLRSLSTERVYVQILDKIDSVGSQYRL
jgi:hypothetical protein